MVRLLFLISVVGHMQSLGNGDQGGIFILVGKVDNCAVRSCFTDGIKSSQFATCTGRSHIIYPEVRWLLSAIENVVVPHEVFHIFYSGF